MLLYINTNNDIRKLFVFLTLENIVILMERQYLKKMIIF